MGAKPEKQVLALAMAGRGRAVPDAPAACRTTKHRVEFGDVSQLPMPRSSRRNWSCDWKNACGRWSGKSPPTSLAPALSVRQQDPLIASIAQRLTEERDIVRVEVLDARGSRAAGSAAGRYRRAKLAKGEWVVFQAPSLRTVSDRCQGFFAAGRKNRVIWMSRAEMARNFTAGLPQRKKQQGIAYQRQCAACLPGITLPLLVWAGPSPGSYDGSVGGPSLRGQEPDRIGQGDSTGRSPVVAPLSSATCNSRSNALRQKRNETTHQGTISTRASTVE